MICICNVRGTSGSGKSYLVKRVMGRYDTKEAIYAQRRLFGASLPNPTQEELGRRAPIAYLLRKKGNRKALVVVGSYETACGGADSLPSIDRGYELVKHFAGQGHQVLFEGLLISELVTQMVDLHKLTQNILVIGLTTPLAECLAAVKGRRDSVGDERELNPKNTENRVRSITRALARLKEAGVGTVELDREAAFKRVCKEFGV